MLIYYLLNMLIRYLTINVNYKLKKWINLHFDKNVKIPNKN